MISAVPARAPIPRAVVVAGAMSGCVAVRIAMNGAGTSSAFVAGATFGVALMLLAVRTGVRLGRPRLESLATGVVGGLLLVGLPIVSRPMAGVPLGLHPEPFLAWLIVTIIVATGEEAILRGSLFDAVTESNGVIVAVATTSIAFALIHVPLYGWHVVPLDLGVGFVLAGLRLWSGGVAAPALAHVVADVATWWM